MVKSKIVDTSWQPLLDKTASGKTILDGEDS